MRRRPPRRARTFEYTRRSASACWIFNPVGNGFFAARSSLVSRPTRSDQSISHRFTPVASANADTTAVCTFSYTRGTLGSTVGRSDGMAVAMPVGSGTNADV